MIQEGSATNVLVDLRKRVHRERELLLELESKLEC